MAGGKGMGREGDVGSCGAFEAGKVATVWGAAIGRETTESEPKESDGIFPWEPDRGGPRTFTMLDCTAITHR